MKKLARIAVPLLLAVSAGSSLALAQAAQAPVQERPSAETIQRLQDGRIAMAKTALKLTDAQMKLWAPVEDIVRKSIADRAAKRTEWQAKRAEVENTPKTLLPDRLQKASERMVSRAAHMKALADALTPLYASFNDEQKAVAGPVFAHLLGHKRGDHERPRWSMNHVGGTPPSKG